MNNNIDTNVKKEGIVVLKTLDTLTINSIAKNVAQVLCSTFPEQNLNYNEIFINLSRLNMYVAEMPKDMSVAKYYYKNSSIYLSNTVNLNHINKCLIHECIHALQTKKDDKNNIINFGLCNMNNSKAPGMALNEASVQLIAESCMKSKKDSVKYFGLDLSTISPDYYPLECALLEQVSYIVGQNILVHSTFTGDNSFENTFINLTSKKCFSTFRKNLDIIMNLEDDISFFNSKLENGVVNSKKALKIAKDISNLKKIIANIFIKTQDLIITEYFNNYLSKINTSKDIENLRNKLYSYKDYIGTTDDYAFYNEYYLKMMTNLEKKYSELEKGTTNYELPTVYREKTINIIINKIKKIFTQNNYSDYYYNEKNK